jgi:hypothetical protein
MFPLLGERVRAVHGREYKIGHGRLAAGAWLDLIVEYHRQHIRTGTTARARDFAQQMA